MHFFSTASNWPITRLLAQINDDWSPIATLAVFFVVALLCYFHRPIAAFVERIAGKWLDALESNLALRLVLAPFAFASVLVAILSGAMGIVLVVTGPLRILINVSFDPLTEIAKGFVLIAIAGVFGAFALSCVGDPPRPYDAGDDDDGGGDDGEEAENDSGISIDGNTAGNVVPLDSAKPHDGKTKSGRSR